MSRRSGPRSERLLRRVAAASAALVEARDDADLRGVERALVDIAAAVAEAGPAGAPAGWLLNLSAAHLTRFELAGVAESLDSAIDAARSAMARGEEEARAGAHAQLAMALRLRFELSGADADLDAAAAAATAAVYATDQASTDRAGRLSNLATVVQARYEARGASGDLTAAVELLRSAVRDAADDDARHGYESNLGLALHLLSEDAGDTAALEAAVDAARSALRPYPPGHPVRPGRLSNLG